MKLLYWLCIGSPLVLMACRDASTHPVSVEPRPLTREVSASGEIVSKRSIVISPPNVSLQWDYKITFLAPDGSSVEEGMPVVGFDASKQEQDLLVKESELSTAKKTLENFALTNAATEAQLKLNLSEAQMQLEKAKRKVAASRGQLASNEIKKLGIDLELRMHEAQYAQQQWEQHQSGYKTQLRAKQAEVNRLTEETNRLSSEIERLTVKAPKSGVVVHRTDWQGNKMKSGDTAYTGQPVVEIPSLDAMIAKAEFIEIDAPWVVEGALVEIRLDTEPDKIYQGRVQQVGRVFRRKSRKDPSIVFDADILIDNPNQTKMRPGMAARIKVLNHKTLSRELSS